VASGGDASTYDVLLYPPRPFVQTHPDRLATLATLFGLSPAPPGRCRVLELGCGSGGNLLPLAAALPGATFVGIDNARVPIARARELAERLELGNVTFHDVGIEEFAPPAEPFDYVIAHGVFSWVPDGVRDALLALCGRVLAPDGVAYVSYNALPGGHLRQMLREALALHIGTSGSPRERVAAARKFLAVLIAAGESDEDLVPTLGRAAREVADRDDAFLFHDVLAEHNRPFHLHEFVALAGGHGLQYLAEAQFSEMQLAVLPPPLRTTLEQIDDRVRRESYLDMLRERRFRQTLLCRAERRVSEPRPERLRGLAVSGALRRTTDEDTGRTTFLGPGTAHVVTDHPLLVRVLSAVAGAWPSPVWIANLGDERELPAIHDMLLRAYAANLVRLHVHPPFVSTAPPERPRVGPVARLEALEGATVTTVRHTHHELDDVARRLVPLLDGSRDRAALRSELGMDDTAVEAALTGLARAGLLLPEDA